MKLIKTQRMFAIAYITIYAIILVLIGTGICLLTR